MNIARKISMSAAAGVVALSTVAIAQPASAADCPSGAFCAWKDGKRVLKTYGNWVMTSKEIRADRVHNNGTRMPGLDHVQLVYYTYKAGGWKRYSQCLHYGKYDEYETAWRFSGTTKINEVTWRGEC